jgi:hypothetical protein
MQIIKVWLGSSVVLGMVTPEFAVIPTIVAGMFVLGAATEYN